MHQVPWNTIVFFFIDTKCKEIANILISAWWKELSTGGTYFSLLRERKHYSNSASKAVRS